MCENKHFFFFQSWAAMFIGCSVFIGCSIYRLFWFSPMSTSWHPLSFLPHGNFPSGHFCSLSNVKFRRRKLKTGVDTKCIVYQLYQSNLLNVMILFCTDMEIYSRWWLDARIFLNLSVISALWWWTFAINITAGSWLTGYASGNSSNLFQSKKVRP